MNKFKIGDRVICNIAGKAYTTGEVVSISNARRQTYPIKVRYDVVGTHAWYDENDLEHLPIEMNLNG